MPDEASEPDVKKTEDPKYEIPRADEPGKQPLQNPFPNPIWCPICPLWIRKTREKKRLSKLDQNFVQADKTLPTKFNPQYNHSVLQAHGLAGRVNLSCKIIMS